MDTYKTQYSSVGTLVVAVFNFYNCLNKCIGKFYLTIVRYNIRQTVAHVASRILACSMLEACRVDFLRLLTKLCFTCSTTPLDTQAHSEDFLWYTEHSVSTKHLYHS